MALLEKRKKELIKVTNKINELRKKKKKIRDYIYITESRAKNKLL